MTPHRPHLRPSGPSGVAARPARAVGTALALGLSASLLAAAPTAATPPEPGGVTQPEGRGVEQEVTTDGLLAEQPGARVLRAQELAGGPLRPDLAPLAMPASYPSQPTLRTFPDASGEPGGDAADTGQVIAYDQIAPTLNTWMSTSDRISAQVVGESTQGRDLYLVTLTAPETEAETRRQAYWRDMIRERPRAAARDQRLAAEYKTPIWVSANIHGNEWEGTDAAMNVIEDLLTAPDAEVGELLERHRLYFSVALNPDGRTIGQRATAKLLDANRDMITNQTPEAVSYVRSAQAIQPLYAADLHGYTDVLQVEPCGPPHGDNYEYDLFIPHAYASALAVERDVAAANIPGNTYYDTESGEVVTENTGNILIPYRDIPSGWDDYPPIFTAQYAAFHGAVTSTVELPLARPNNSSQTPGNAVVNVAVGEQTIHSLLDYVADNSADMLANQVEMFRRGVAGEPKEQLTGESVAQVPGPQEWKPLWDVADDQNPVDLPRAYLIPMDRGQRSLSDANRLVAQLLFHGVEVDRLTRPLRVGGTRYAAGTYVVDMHQPLRGLANSLLDVGADISAKVPEMYDVSGWSLALLWGATVDRVGSTTDAWRGEMRRVRKPVRVGSVDGFKRAFTFDLAGVEDYRALNGLLDDGLEVSVLDDGTPVFDPADSAAVRRAARVHDIVVTTASKRQVREAATAKKVDEIEIAYAGTQDDLLSLTELGFGDLVPVSAASLAADPALLDGVDALWVGSPLVFDDATAAGRAAVADFVAEGNPVLGRGMAGATAAAEAGVVQATAVPADPYSNGIVDVDTRSGGVLAPFPQDAAFVYPAVHFTGLGAGTRAEQTYGPDPLLAGHWVGSTATDTEEAAAGQAAVVSGQAASGAKGFVFGTSVFFRTHPKGGLSQAARAILWAVD